MTTRRIRDLFTMAAIAAWAILIYLAMALPAQAHATVTPHTHAAGLQAGTMEALLVFLLAPLVLPMCSLLVTQRARSR